MRTAITAFIITMTLIFAAHAALAEEYCTARHLTVDNGDEIDTIYEYTTCPVNHPNPNAPIMQPGAIPQVGDIDPENGQEVVDYHTTAPAQVRHSNSDIGAVD